MTKLLVINGPNLNLLGTREPEHYGHASLQDIEATLRARADELSIELDFFQSNAEHQLLERIHAAADEGVDMILINPAAYTHTSVALRDALLGVAIPYIEVHLSNPHSREAFRQHSYFSDRAVGVVSGFGYFSYLMALHAAHHHITGPTHQP